MKDLYEVLEVSPSASAEVIEAAWRALQKKHHPDNKATGNGARASEINDAHDVLKTPASRRAYDQMRMASQPANGHVPNYNPFAYPAPYGMNMQELLAQASLHLGGQMLGNLLNQLDPNHQRIIWEALREAKR